MNQRLPPPSRRSRHFVPLHSSGWHPVRPRRFTLQVRVRGQIGPAWQVSCTGLEDAIQFGEAEFPAFVERNPWIGLDSFQRQIWILLDPETESTSSRK
jgi:hypothetical protein